MSLKKVQQKALPLRGVRLEQVQQLQKILLILKIMVLKLIVLKHMLLQKQKKLLLMKVKVMKERLLKILLIFMKELKKKLYLTTKRKLYKLLMKVLIQKDLEQNLQLANILLLQGLLTQQELKKLLMHMNKETHLYMMLLLKKLLIKLEKIIRKIDNL